MSVYWFIDLDAVARRNLLYELMQYSNTVRDMFLIGLGATHKLMGKRRKGANIPL